MPMEELRSEAEEAVALSAAMGERPPLSVEEALAQGLLRWFKTGFFRWVCWGRVWARHRSEAGGRRRGWGRAE